MAEQQGDVALGQDQQLTPRQSAGVRVFRMLERFADEMDRMFDEIGLGRGWTRSPTVVDSMTWAPDIEISQRDSELVVLADLPGLSNSDVQIDVTEIAITIRGERRREHDGERADFYRSERSYGSFYRAIPLPAGAMTDHAKASFKDGVLEITMPAPPIPLTRGRRLEMNGGAAKGKEARKGQ
jgi:HSP20 family protein